MSLLRLLRARTRRSWVYSHPSVRPACFLLQEALPARTPGLVGAYPFLSPIDILHVRELAPKSVQATRGLQFWGRVVVAWRIRQYAWKVQRCTRVVGQILLHAVANPLPPSVTTRAGGAIRLMSAPQAREFSLLAAYQPSTQSGVWAMSTTAFSAQVDAVDEDDLMHFIDDRAERP